MSLTEKMIAVQSALKAPKSQKNTFANYNYRSCEDILEAAKPLLKENGLMLTIKDEVVLIGDRYYVKATARITDGEEYTETTAYAREAEDRKGLDCAQLTGSTSSYARKYCLNGLLCIDDTKDSDALPAEDKSDKKPEKKPVQKPKVWICEDCGKTVTGTSKYTADEVASRAQKAFGHIYCAECGMKHC